MHGIFILNGVSPKTAATPTTEDSLDFPLVYRQHYGTALDLLISWPWAEKRRNIHTMALACWAMLLGDGSRGFDEYLQGGAPPVIS